MVTFGGDARLKMMLLEDVGQSTHLICPWEELGAMRGDIHLSCYRLELDFWRMVAEIWDGLQWEPGPAARRWTEAVCQAVPVGVDLDPLLRRWRRNKDECNFTLSRRVRRLGSKVVARQILAKLRKL